MTWHQRHAGSHSKGWFKIKSRGPASKGANTSSLAAFFRAFRAEKLQRKAVDHE